MNFSAEEQNRRDSSYANPDPTPNRIDLEAQEAYNQTKPLVERNSATSGKHSPSGSSLSSLSESDGFVLVDPTGKIFHGKKLQSQSNQGIAFDGEAGLGNRLNPRAQMYPDPLNDLASIPIPSMTREMQQRLEIEINQFKTYNTIFQLFLLVQLVYDIYSTVKTFIYMDDSIDDLAKFYKGITKTTLKVIFITLVSGTQIPSYFPLK